MEIGIVGLPASGKTTLYNALTGGTAETATVPPPKSTGVTGADGAPNRVDTCCGSPDGVNASNPLPTMMA